MVESTSSCAPPVGHWQCHGDDTVGIALQPLSAGRTLAVGGRRVTLRDPIPAGHKFALLDHSVAAAVVRYGEPIGVATAPIEAGQHVHSHNLGTALAGERRYEAGVSSASSASAEPLGEWRGYRRADGRYATRN